MLREFLIPQMGHCFEATGKQFWAPASQWNQPNYKINVSEDKKM